MKAVATEFKDFFILEPTVFEDDRGYFMESFNKKVFQEITGLDYDFVQDNESLSGKDILRGLHFQVAPYVQGKLIRVVRGAVLDVCVDIRRNSTTFGKHIKVELSESNKRSLFIPPGFAHGFVTLEKNTLFQYKCTEYYHKPSERTLQWNDPELGIDWVVEIPLLSEKDRNGMSFSDLCNDLTLETSGAVQ